MMKDKIKDKNNLNGLNNQKISETMKGNETQNELQPVNTAVAADESMSGSGKSISGKSASDEPASGGQIIYNGLSEIDDELVLAAVPKEINTGNIVSVQQHRKKRNRVLRWGSAVAVCLVLFAVGGYNMFLTPAAKVFVTINPSMYMELNRAGSVMDVEPLNSDAFDLLQGYNYDGKDRETVAEELVQRAIEMGYLTDDGQVTFSVDAASQSLMEKYDDEFENTVASFIGNLTNAKVNVRNLITSKEAQQLALDYYGLKSADFSEIKYDIEHKRAIFEMEFTSNGKEYECEIDAINGQVLESDVDFTDNDLNDDNDLDDTIENALGLDDASGNTNAAGTVVNGNAAASAGAGNSLSGTGTSAANSGSVIPESSAKSIALGRAGLSTATFTEIKLENGNGIQKYEMEFYSGNVEYDCEVNAITGAVLEYDSDTEHDLHDTHDVDDHYYSHE